MIGWGIFAAVALVVLAGLRLVARADRGSTLLILSALFVAAAGYAWQGNPGLAGAPSVGKVQQGLKPDTIYMIERQRLLSPYGEAGQWMVLADGLNRAGEDRAAVTALQGAVAKFPRDTALRVAHAHTLLVMADYTVTPAVQLAFDRAVALDPNDPAPRYFEGLAHFEGGDAGGAARIWQALDEALPAKSPWHEILVERLRLLMLIGSVR